jgi:hypothetical protein
MALGSISHVANRSIVASPLVAAWRAALVNASFARMTNVSHGMAPGSVSHDVIRSVFVCPLDAVLFVHAPSSSLHFVSRTAAAAHGMALGSVNHNINRVVFAVLLAAARRMALSSARTAKRPLLLLILLGFQCRNPCLHRRQGIVSHVRAHTATPLRRQRPASSVRYFLAACVARRSDIRSATVGCHAVWRTVVPIRAAIAHVAVFPMRFFCGVVSPWGLVPSLVVFRFRVGGEHSAT